MRRAKKWHRQLALLKPCRPAVEWARKFDSYDDAWRACENPGWLEWLIRTVHGGRSHKVARAEAAWSATSCLMRRHRPDLTGFRESGVETCIAIRFCVAKPRLPDLPS